MAGLDLPRGRREQRVKRAQRGAEREELLASLDELAAWYRDLVVVAPVRTAPSSTPTGSTISAPTRPAASATALSARPSSCREAWRAAEEFNVNPSLWLEALFVRLSPRTRRLTSEKGLAILESPRRRSSAGRAHHS